MPYKRQRRVEKEERKEKVRMMERNKEESPNNQMVFKKVDNI